MFAGLLPLATALFATLRAGERPSRAFWAFSGLGSLVTVAFAVTRLPADASSTLPSGPTLVGDGLMLAAVLVCGLGYAEGGRLARRLGGWQVIAWADVLCLPLTLPLTLAWRPEDIGRAPATAWAGLAYVGLASMLVGFVFWYRALARGGIARVGQLQLLQPFFGVGLAALLLGDPVEPGMLAAALAVVACVAAARRFA